MIRRLASAVAAALPEPLFRRIYYWRDTTRMGSLLLTPFARLLRSDDARIARGPGTGLLISGAGENASYALGIAEPEVQEMMQAHLAPGGTFYDVGANVGFFSLIASRLVGEAGTVVAFEPVPGTAEMLEANVARNALRNVRVQRVAASDEEGRVEMVVGEVSQTARLADAPAAAPETAHRVRVRSASIDGMIAAGEIPPPSFVKMDIEGAETLALAGMRRTLRAHRPIVLCEVHDTLADVTAELEQAGYACSAVEGRSLSGIPLNAHVLALPA